MNKLKRFFVCFFIAIFVMTTVTACGGNTSVAIPATEETVDQNAVDYQGEGQVQGGIKSDDEIAALQEEEQQYIDDSTTTEYESNEGHEPDSFGSGNFQDYWQGEDFFDIVSYAKANGCTQVFYLDGNGNYLSVNDEEHAVIYSFYFSGTWQVIVTFSECTVIYEGNNERSPEYMVTPLSSLDSIQDNASISRNNDVTMPLEIIQAFSTIVTQIHNDPTNLDPLSGTGLQYVQMN